MFVTRFLVQHPLAHDKVLLLNTLSGAIDIADSSVVDLLERCKTGETTTGDEADIALLEQRGYLLPSAEEEERLLHSVIELGKHIKKRIQFVLCPTYTCNLRCFYCYEPLESRKGNTVMSIEQVRQAFAAIRQLREERSAIPEVGLTVFGGEPLLPTSRSAVQEILAQAAHAGMRLTFVTNGTHVADFRAEVQRYREWVSFQVTVDGPAEVHDVRRVDAGGRGTFDVIARNITWLLENGFPTLVRINLDRQNVEHIPVFLDQVEHLGWSRFPHFRGNIAPVTDRGDRNFDEDMATPLELVRRLVHLVPDLSSRLRRTQFSFTPDMFRNIWPFAKQLYPEVAAGEWGPTLNFCEATYLGYYVFGPDGLIYPCAESVATDAAIGQYWPELQIDRERADRWESRTVLALPECQTCEYALICGGGCAWVAARMHGTPARPNCEIKQRLHRSLKAITPELVAFANTPEPAEGAR